MKKYIFILIAFFIGIGAGVYLMYFISKNKTENNIPKENYSNDDTKQTVDEAPTNRDSELKTTDKTVQFDNPIDEYYLPQINNIYKSMSETRALQYAYGYVWREEYKNIIKWIEDKCDNTENLQSVQKLNESIEASISDMEDVAILEWREALEGEELAPGVGEIQALSYVRGRLYRTYSLELIQNYSGDEPYQYIEQDYSKIQLP